MAKNRNVNLLEKAIFSGLLTRTAYELIAIQKKCVSEINAAPRNEKAVYTARMEIAMIQKAAMCFNINFTAAMNTDMYRYNLVTGPGRDDTTLAAEDKDGKKVFSGKLKSGELKKLLNNPGTRAAVLDFGEAWRSASEQVCLSFIDSVNEKIKNTDFSKKY